MNKTLKIILLDLLSGLLSLVIVYIIGTYITSSESIITLSLALIFLLAGLLFKSSSVPLWVRVIIIDFFALIYLPVTGELSMATLPYPVTAVIFTSIGLIIRNKWKSMPRTKSYGILIASFITYSAICLLFIPKYVYHFSTYFNKPAPIFDMYTFDGNTINSSELKGKIILIDFWSTNCRPCIDLMPQMENLCKKYHDNPDVEIFCLNPGWESFEKAKDFVERTDYNLPFLYDKNSTASNLLKVYCNPITIIIDTKYRLRIKHLGYHPSKDILKDFSKYIDRFLTEKQIDITSSCNYK